MAFNIGTGIETDINTIFEKIKKCSGSTQERINLAPKPGEQRRSCISNDKARKILKWEPSVKLDQGIEQTVAYFKSNP
jgi:UDP-glucose 4-epimerase